MIRASFQDFLEPRYKALIFTWITLLHFSQIRNRPGDPLRFNPLDIVPRLGEALDGWAIGRPAGPFLYQITEHVDDAAELAPVAVLSDNFLLCRRGAGIFLRHVNIITDEPARKNRLSEYLRSKRRGNGMARAYISRQSRDHHASNSVGSDTAFMGPR